MPGIRSVSVGCKCVQSVDRELDLVNQERVQRQGTWHRKLEALYAEWNQHLHEQMGWQAALDCLNLGVTLNGLLMEAANAYSEQLK